MLGEKDTGELLGILNILNGRGRIRRGKGLYVARANAIAELKKLIKFHGAENVKTCARNEGWSLLDDNGPPENWRWSAPATDDEVRRATKTKNATAAIKNPPVLPADVYRVHHEKLDVAHGQKCACAVCEEYRGVLEKEEQEKKETEEKEKGKDTRWGWLEIDD